MHENISRKLPVLSQTSKNIMFFFLSFSFYKIREQEGGKGPTTIGKVGRRMNTAKICVCI
jgi:hypothetical protein